MMKNDSSTIAVEEGTVQIEADVPMVDLTDDEKIDIVAARILEKHKAAFIELAK